MFIARPPRQLALHRLLFSTSASSKSRVTIGIRREDPNRIWERRCPLTPQAVETLIRETGVRVLVQPCERRVFRLDDFVQAGAEPHSSLQPAHILLGIKETPLDELLVDPVNSPDPVNDNSLVPRTHFMFSHTTKGQSYNMPLLSRFLANKPSSPLAQADIPNSALLPTLIDYELLTNEEGKRTVGFGWFAGVAGTLEGLISTAHMFLELGVATPFLNTPRPHTATLPELRKSLQNIGKNIWLLGTPRRTGPFIVCVTGTGHVANGALSMLEELPVEYISVDDLPRLTLNTDTPLNKIYVLHAKPEVYLTHKDGSLYSRQSYYGQPTLYKSQFHEKIAPYVSLLINGVGWSPGFPRLMTTDQLASALESVHHMNLENNEVMNGRCRSFADISCDVSGGLEFLPRTSTLSDPFFTYRPPGFSSHLPSLTIMAVDILPTALSQDASISFSQSILPYLRETIASYGGHTLTSYDKHSYSSEALEHATVAKCGKLVKPHDWLYKLVNTDTSTSSLPHSQQSSNTTMFSPKKVLLLGSGLVAAPAVDELCSRSDVQLLLASNDSQRIRTLTSAHSNAKGLCLDLNDTGTLEDLIAEADVVTSLLPVSLHPYIAEFCIKHKKHLVTASYISPAMQNLHERALDADILLLNEVGLDPGIDHCLVHSLMASLRQQNKRVTSFVSFCGGLPAPEYADVPLKYKFSWSPQGVLRAVLNPALFRLDGKTWNMSSDLLLYHKLSDLPISPVLKLEGLPNRDSISYADTYSLGPANNLQTLIRGTLRYPGFCDLMQCFKLIGLLETQSHILLPVTTKSFLPKCLEIQLGFSITSDSQLLGVISDLISPDHHHMAFNALSWLSLLPTPFQSTEKSMALSTTSNSPLDIFATILSQKLHYESHERDLVILHHEITTCSQDSSPHNYETHVASLQLYGSAHNSAMSQCVGLPVAIATLQVLDGNIGFRGVQGPTEASLYSAILDQLDVHGICFQSSLKQLSSGQGDLESSIIQQFSKFQ